MTRIPFFKMSACGNDFCLVDNRDGLFPGPIGLLVRQICKRRISLGADGLILLEGSESASFRMRFFNSDGGQAEMCGNGARCVARFAYINGIAPSQMSFVTDAGPVEAQVLERGIRIGLGDLAFSASDSRVMLTDVMPDRDFYYITVGVPHVVCITDDLEKIDVQGLGKRIRYHAMFEPKGTNVNFVKITGPNSLSIRTYERGVEGETLACGTGSTAAAIVASSVGLVTPPVKVMTKSGCPLRIGFNSDGDHLKHLWLEGEARVVCSGDIWLDEIADE